MAQQELSHYGVLGMKWGVRKDPGRAYRKASAQRGKLERNARRKAEKSARLNLKASKLDQKVLKADLRGDSPKKLQKLKKKAYRARSASVKANLRSVKTASKGQRWVAQMEKYFDSTSMSQISKDDIAAGKEYYLKYASKR